MTTTWVHLLRHGEVANPDGVLYGRLPGYRLSERGEAMAMSAARWLAGDADGPRRDVALLLASPLLRAQQTAAPVASAFDLPIETEPRLIEADSRFEGQRPVVAVFARPANWRKIANPFRPSWGEPYARQAERVLAVVAEARARAEGREAVLVSHQSPIWLARRELEGRRLWHDPRRRECSLASLTSLRYDGDRLAEIVYAEPAAALSGVR